VDGRTAGVLLPAIGHRQLVYDELRYCKRLFDLFNYYETIAPIIRRFPMFSKPYCTPIWLHLALSLRPEATVRTGGWHH
jgi:hypothetical protein